MRSIPMVALLVLSFSLASCKKGETPEVQMLVSQLPAGTEGVELTKNGLRAMKGYRFVKDSDSTLAIERIEGGTKVGGAGCGCKSGTGCNVVDQGGIAVCQAEPECSKCGLALTGPTGVRTELYENIKTR
jgi:hypothetical protein